MKILVLDRVQAAVSLITKVDEQIQFPAELSIPHPIRLIKEAEQLMPASQCRICGSQDHLEQHHVAGRSNYPDIVTLCKRCHDELSNIYQPKWLPWADSRTACYLLGWSDLFHMLRQKTEEGYFLELSKIFAQNAGYAK